MLPPSGLYWSVLCWRILQQPLPVAHLPVPATGGQHAAHTLRSHILSRTARDSTFSQTKRLIIKDFLFYFLEKKKKRLHEHDEGIIKDYYSRLKGGEGREGNYIPYGLYTELYTLYFFVYARKVVVHILICNRYYVHVMCLELGLGSPRCVELHALGRWPLQCIF